MLNFIRKLLCAHSYVIFAEKRETADFNGGVVYTGIVHKGLRCSKCGKEKLETFYADHHP